MTKRKKTIIILSVAAVVIAAVCVLMSYMQKVDSYQTKVGEISFADIDVTAYADGIYTGECDVDFIYAKVKVTVKSGAIEDIELLEHRHEQGLLAESIVGEIIRQQRVDVNEVSGATNSSRVIKKAVDNALSSSR